MLLLDVVKSNIKYGIDKSFNYLLCCRVILWDKFNKQVFLKVHVCGGGALCYVELTFDISTVSSKCVKRNCICAESLLVISKTADCKYYFQKYFEILNLNTTLVGDIWSKVKGKGKGKGTVAPVSAMKAYGRAELELPLVSNLGTWWRWVVSFTPKSNLPPRKELSVEGWVGSRAHLEALAKRKI